VPERRFDETGDFFEVRRAELRGMEKGRIAPPRASAAVEEAAQLLDGTVETNRHESFNWESTLVA
jgi:hypothetical protein